MENIPSPQSFIFSDDYICQWDSCLKNFDDAEMLYEHLRDEHVGRKAHHNLCLTCKWDKCSVPTFAKRDHITSHLRVHVASKPYRCDVSLTNSPMAPIAHKLFYMFPEDLAN